MYRWRVVPTHSPNGERSFYPVSHVRHVGGGLHLEDIPSSHSQAPTAQVGTPGGGPCGPARFSSTTVAVGGFCPDSKSFNPRTGAENQEDPKSMNEGTKQLSSSPW